MRTIEVTPVITGEGLSAAVLPFYYAEEKNTLERGSRPYSVVDILRDIFKEDFRKRIQTYVDRYPEDVVKAVGIPDACGFQLTWLGEPRVESSLSQPACTTAVDLIFKASFTAIIHTGRNRQVGTSFRIRYLMGLWDRKCSAPVIAPDSQFPSDLIKEQKTSITNQYLLPVMYEEDYVKSARHLLKLYYPEALNAPTAVDGMELAKRMKLHVRRVRFENGSDIQGRIYFDSAWVTLRDENGRIRKEMIPPMTVLVNIELCPTPEIENSTVVHECCHVYLDLPFFKLQMLSGNPYTSYTNRKRRRRYSRDNTPVDWMELQAEKLPAYVLMEEKNTDMIIRQYLDEYGGDRTPENIYRVICRLASYFRVTRSMAKYRMIELGYPEAEGVYTYIDNMRIPDYGCGCVWKKGITYAISRFEAAILLKESKEFVTALMSGRYIYVDGHFCLDESRYILTDCRHNKHMTEYARHHIEECCISFTVQGRYTNGTYEDAKAARKIEVKDRYLSRHGFSAEPDTKARVRENELFAQDSRIWMMLCRNMPESIGEAVQLILNEKGISQMELAMRLGVSRTAWRKWCSERMSLRHIVAICIALDIRADVGWELVRLAGQTFTNDSEHDILRAMLYETKDLTVARANEIMRQEKLKPLTAGMDEELAC